MTTVDESLKADRALKAWHRAMWALGDYPAVGDDLDRLAELDPDLADLARRHYRGAGTTVIDWEYLLATSRKRS